MKLHPPYHDTHMQFNSVNIDLEYIARLFWKWRMSTVQVLSKWLKQNDIHKQGSWKWIDLNV